MSSFFDQEAGWRGLAETRRQRGFTLMELLVAMTLLGILMAALFGGLRLGARVWEASDKALDRSSETEIVRGFLRSRLEQVLPMSVRTSDDRKEALFRGDRETLRFAAFMPASLGSGPFLLELSLRHRGVSDPVNDLLLSWRPLDASREVDPSATGERVLIEDVAEIAFGYFSGGGEQAGVWFDNWRAQTTLPALIRIELGFPGTDQRRWFPLTVSPMIDDWYDTAY